VLRAGGDAGVVANLFQEVAMLTGALGVGIWGAFDSLTGDLNPWVRLAIASTLVAGGGYLYRRQPDHRRERFRDGLSRGFEVLGAFAEEYMTVTARLDRALPMKPSWEQLAHEQQRAHILTRACLYQLTRSRQGHRSAVELAEELPRLGVGQSAPKMRQVLRTHPGCFEQVYPGRWQVGTALVRSPRDSDGTG
jgi:hypothetical protein